MSTEDRIVARDGDVLVVTYGDIKLPLTSTKFAMVEVGGLIYTRQLCSGDDVAAEQARIYAYLQRTAERDARDKIRRWNEVLAEARTQTAATIAANLPPKPTVQQR